MNPQTQTESEPLKTQRTMFDLDTMEEVVLRKQTPFTDAKDETEALARLGNNKDRLIAVINRGLRAELGNELAKDETIPWQEVDDEGNYKPFSGTAVIPTDVNVLILNLAKQAFGYKKDGTLKSRQDAKKAAKDFLKSPAASILREGIKKSTAEAVAVPDAE